MHLHLMLAAKVWHYWMAIPLIAAGVLMIVVLIVGYLVKVVGPRYPRQ
jgi:hypothetical protein